MGITQIIRERRMKVQAARVDRLQAASGDRRAQMKLVKEERRLLEEKESLRSERSKVRELRVAPVKRVVKNFREAIRQGQSRAKAASKKNKSRSEEIFGTGKSKNPFSEGGRNPFNDE